MSEIKLFCGPMSKLVTFAVAHYANYKNVKLGLIPSRRQVDFDGGYTGWSTQEFSQYVRSRSKNVILQRDHGGPDQGNVKDDGLVSFSEDLKYLNMIHIDPWKKYSDLGEGISHTIDYIKYCYDINPNIQFEIGTEEAIRPYDANELFLIIASIKSNLKPEMFNQIKYAVIQSGTALKEGTNIGTYDESRIKDMLKVCKEFKLLSKEHNGDYLDNEQIRHKFGLGLDSINIAPEFGRMESEPYLELIGNREELFEAYFQLCLDSKKWEKWVSPGWDPHQNKTELIQICGHYVLNSESFKKEIKDKVMVVYPLLWMKFRNKVSGILNNDNRI